MVMAILSVVLFIVQSKENQQNFTMGTELKNYQAKYIHDDINLSITFLLSAHKC